MSLRKVLLITKEVREKYASPDTLVIAGKDGVHPDDQGGFYMSYLMIKQQGGTPIVAKVEIDASNGEKQTERADVKVLDYASDRVEYEYLAHAIPIACTDVYKIWENWGVNVTEELNNEIICVRPIRSILKQGTFQV